ncbi:MAG: DUF362 domain-containing protein [Candidatus Methanoperedens sp.]|nr:DUF362 domain-containing protein [Candidatus Methanoperedens sp.]
MTNGIPNTRNKHPPVTRVSAVECTSYDTKAVESAVRRAIDTLGGIGKFASNGETILLKPNLLQPKSPEEAVTTHPEIVRAMIRLVRETGANPVVGDSPGGRCSEKMLHYLAQKTGMDRVCEEEGVEFIFLIDSQTVSFPQGGIIRSFNLASYLSRVAGVISLAKLKTHTLTGLTGAVKNTFGLIPGLEKSDIHSRIPDVNEFSEMLVDLAECVRPRLSVVDGILAMEGDGPTAGVPRHIGRIVASENPHALDAFLAGMVGAGNIPTVEIARRRGLVPNDIEVIGDASTATRVEGFKMPPKPHAFGMIRGLLGYGLNESFSRKPVFLDSRCTLCGSCIEACPAEALRKGKKMPVIDRKLCIRCYCCQEVCGYKAIELRRQLLRSMGEVAAAGIKRYLKVK